MGKEFKGKIETKKQKPFILQKGKSRELKFEINVCYCK